MPIYDVRCPKCDTAWEHFGKFGDRMECPACGCREQIKMLPAAPKAYWIKGDNSASVTPKRHRKEGKDGGS